MKRCVPQYLENGMWKDMDFETGKDYSTPVPTQRIFEEYAKTNLYYSFNIGVKHHHEHDFASVLKYCFDYPESFNLNEEDKTFYTNDQINFLNKLQNQCLLDELKDIMIDNTFVLSELEKRNYQTIINNLKEDSY